MSQLIDRLNRATKSAPEPLGFRPSHPASLKSQILLIASLAQAETAGLSEYAANADAILLHLAKSSSGAEDIRKIASALHDIPWGGWMENVSDEEEAEIVKTGCDFLVFPVSRAVTVADQNSKVGRILQIETSLSDGMLRAINELPVDAVLISDKKEAKHPLTWYSLMLFQHLASLLAKPLLVSMPLEVVADEFILLWEAGVDGVVIEVGKGQLEGLEKLRESMANLNFATRKRGKAEALVPYLGGAGAEIEEEEEE